MSFTKATLFSSYKTKITDIHDEYIIIIQLVYSLHKMSKTSERYFHYDVMCTHIKKLLQLIYAIILYHEKKVHETSYDVVGGTYR